MLWFSTVHPRDPVPQPYSGARPEEHFSFNVKWASAAHGGAARVAIGVVARHAVSRGP